MAVSRAIGHGIGQLSTQRPADLEAAFRPGPRHGAHASSLAQEAAVYGFNKLSCVVDAVCQALSIHCATYVDHYTVVVSLGCLGEDTRERALKAASLLRSRVKKLGET